MPMFSLVGAVRVLTVDDANIEQTWPSRPDRDLMIEIRLVWMWIASTTSRFMLKLAYTTNDS